MILGAVYDALTYKANAEHEHPISSIIDLESSLTGKADVGHTHSISNVENLESSLTGKANLSHTQPISSITNLETTLNNKSNISHGHPSLTTNLISSILSGSSTFICPSSVTNSSNIKIYIQDMSAAWDRNIHAPGSESHYWWLNLIDGEGNGIMQARVVKYDYANSNTTHSILFRFPDLKKDDWETDGFNLAVKFVSGISVPLLTWGTSTVGDSAELTRVDYVKSKIKGGVPDREHGIAITSNWPTSGWTNTLGDGWVHVYLPVNRISYVIQDESTIVLGQYTVDSSASNASGVNYTLSHWMPVVSGKVYKVKDNAATTTSGRAVDNAVWCPIKV